MDANLSQRYDASHRLSKSLSDEWRELCALYLPVVSAESIWRHSRVRTALDAEQGWKLHVSATVLTANKVLERIGPFLQSRGTLCKGPSTLQELNKLNCGLYYGYTQIGKCITVYPRTVGEAVSLAEGLHELTRGMPAPAVPFDLRLRPGSCVYYRYGAFTHQEIENEDGSTTLALHSPEGKLVPDSRESHAAKPDWVTDPFQSRRPADDAPPSESPLGTTFRVFRALKQRGKGGVYQAFDLSTKPPRLCVLKEGRQHGEPCWDGRDGYWRVENEKKNLSALRGLGIDVPRVYASFEVEGRFYLVTEFIEGVSLQALLNRRKRRLPIRRALRYALQLSGILSQIHAACWVWRDCKPSNLMVMEGGAIRPLDFEGACPADQPDPTPWSTDAFAPPESDGNLRGQTGAAADLYALGVIIYYLLSGTLPSMPDPTPVEKLRRNTPVAARRLLSGLLNPDPQRRPCAQSVTQVLKAELTPGKDPHR